MGRRSRAVALLSLVTLGFVLRVGLRLADGEPSIVEGGYQFYARIAQTFVAGGGFCLQPGTSCALRLPLYPLILSPFIAAGWLYPGIVLLQAAIGASLVWLAAAIGRLLFDDRTALLAAAAVALSPYGVVHDTALQDTVVVNALMACGVWLLLRAARRPPGPADAAAGLVLALAVLTTARVAVIVACALAWLPIATFDRRAVGAAVRRAVLVALPAVVLVGGWLVRNQIAVGAPVLTTESGESFWAGNSAWTFDYLPDRSIDLAVGQAYASLSDDRRRQLAALGGQDVERDRLLARWGWEYVGEHPLQVLGRACRKVWMAASGQLSPSRGRLVSLGYLVVFAGVRLLALAGLWRGPRSRQDRLLVPIVLAGFAVTTAIYWAHTSHTSVIDLFLFVYAAAGLTRRDGSFQASA